MTEVEGILEMCSWGGALKKETPPTPTSSYLFPPPKSSSWESMTGGQRKREKRGKGRKGPGVKKLGEGRWGSRAMGKKGVSSFPHQQFFPAGFPGRARK